MTWTHDEIDDLNIDFDDPAVQRAYAVHGTLLDTMIVNGHGPVGPIYDGTGSAGWDADCETANRGFDSASYVDELLDRMRRS